MNEEQKGVIEDELEGRCTHCGKPMKEKSNHQWKVYCVDKECQDAFIKEVLKKVK